jgi:hypothetical protein
MYAQELLHNQTLTQIGVQVNLSLRCVTQKTKNMKMQMSIVCQLSWTMHRSILNWCEIAINP